MRALNDVLDRLPPARQRKIDARAKELIAAEQTLQDMRKTQEKT
jgi:hypothetical protein